MTAARAAATVREIVTVQGRPGRVEFRVRLALPPARRLQRDAWRAWAAEIPERPVEVVDVQSASPDVVLTLWPRSPMKPAALRELLLAALAPRG